MLKPPTPGLHRIHNKSKQTAKVQVNVAPYDELEVSADVAAQLEQSGQFAEGAAPEWPDEWNAPAPDAAAEEAPPAPKKAARAKKAARSQ